MQRIRIRLIKDYQAYQAGETITVPEAVARKLYRKGVAYRDKIMTRMDYKK